MTAPDDPRPTLGKRKVPPAPQKARPRVRGLVWKLPLALAVTAIAIGLGGALWVQISYLRDLPPIPSQDALWAVNRAPGMTFLDKDGKPIAHRGPRNGRRVELSRLPPHVTRAFLAAEDRRYYEHGPVDLRGIVRAARANWEAGHTVQGGSTLTQQLARNLFLSPEQTWKRKLQEAGLAWKLEDLLGKDGVFELYLNRTFFGANAYGLAAASEVYFAKPPERLTLGEAALLAALPKAPSRLSPRNGMDAAWARGRTVLATMREMGWITERQEAEALAHPPVLAKAQRQPEGDLAYVLDMAAAQAQQIAGDRAPDLIVRLTVDPALQGQAQAIVRGAVRGEGRRRRATQAALVALDKDGAIRALIGGTDHEASPYNRAVQALRQPGSAFKPFVYAAALERGVRPYDIVTDTRIEIGNWSPENYGGGRYGAMTVEQALARSVNTVAVKLAREAGVREVAGIARRFGLSTIPEEPGLSVALGAYEVNLLALTGAYQVFQNGGGRSDPYLISEIQDARGEILFLRPPGAPVPAYEPAQAAKMVGMMQKVITDGTGYRAAFGGWPIAAKTGTSQDWRDAWFVGFTSEWAVGVWVGNDDNTSMRKVVGGELPADIWRRFMVVAHEGREPHGFDWTLPFSDEPIFPIATGPLDEEAPEDADGFDIARRPPSLDELSEPEDEALTPGALARRRAERLRAFRQAQDEAGFDPPPPPRYEEEPEAEEYVPPYGARPLPPDRRYRY